MFRQFNNLLFAPSGDGKSGGSTGVIDIPADMDHEDIIDFLGEDDEIIPLEEKKEDKKTKKDEKEVVTEKEEDEEYEEEETDELDDIEAELEEPTDDQLELVTPVRRKEILKAYPDLFKKFPYLEKAYYREQQFTEILPTIKDAKEAVEKAQTLDKFENDLMDGKTELMLKAVKNSNPKAFNKLVDNYLTVLSNVDEKAYHHVIGNTIKHVIVAMVKEGRASNNETLQNAAQIVNQFTFGSSEFVPPTQLSKQESQEEDNKNNELNRREQAFIKQQFDSTRDDLNSRVNNTLKNTINSNIDPKQSMTDYMRRNASREALETLEELISKDSRFKVLVDKLWEKAFEEKFTKVSTDRIKSAYLSKAKTLLPSVIKKARNEALRGMGKRVSDEEESEEQPNRKGPTKSERPRSPQHSGKISKPEDIPKGMRTLDFLMRD